MIKQNDGNRNRDMRSFSIEGQNENTLSLSLLIHSPFPRQRSYQSSSPDSSCLDAKSRNDASMGRSTVC